MILSSPSFITLGDKNMNVDMFDAVLFLFIFPKAHDGF